MNAELAVSKLDASKRQLETAIRLYFQNGDPVSIHTLTAAAYNVIRDINQKRGGSPMLTKDKLLEFVKPGLQKTFRDKLNEAENFFKHADRDHNATMIFYTAQTEFLIIDAASQYSKLTEEDPPLFVVFRGWFMARHPDLFTLPPDVERTLSMTAASIQEVGRHDYFNAFLPLVMRAHA